VHIPTSLLTHTPGNQPQQITHRDATKEKPSDGIIIVHHGFTFQSIQQYGKSPGTGTRHQLTVSLSDLKSKAADRRTVKPKALD